MRGRIQALRLKNQEDIFYVINVIEVVDCLDYDRSKIKRYPSFNRVMDVIQYVFVKSKLRDKIIFKLPEFVNRKIYVTEEFKKAIEENDNRLKLEGKFI